MSALPVHVNAGAELYLRTITAGAPTKALLDVRYRAHGNSLARIFIDASAPDAANIITRIGARTDVYVGCAMRVRRRGTRHDLAPTRLLWADCDSSGALQALDAFEPRPTMTIASGGKDHAHAYWTLTRPLQIEELEHANRTLAQALGADGRCVDAARILRPPDTLNFKHDPPATVELVEYTGRRYDLAQLLATLPTTHSIRAVSPALCIADARRSDPLQLIKPAHYVRLLTGQAPGRDGKIICPFHDDRTPSLHVYDTPEQGWSCYGCPTRDGKPIGGDIYTLASLLWGIPTHGRSFLDLRARLDDVFRVCRT